MLASMNAVANAIIFAGSLWAVLTHKLPTRTGGLRARRDARP
ncbi:hypothetical protein [Ralstonia solanacearum]|nr:hypothetical protein [Ralstonia solanacearum]